MGQPPLSLLELADSARPQAAFWAATKKINRVSHSGIPTREHGQASR
jgi:hypothetical protein